MPARDSKTYEGLLRVRKSWRVGDREIGTLLGTEVEKIE